MYFYNILISPTQVVLPTVLRGYVPSVHRAILTLISALRQLDGQVYSYADAKDLGVRPGSHCVVKAQLPALHHQLVIGLSDSDDSPMCGRTKW